MLEIVVNYQHLLDNLETYISESKFKKEYLISELSISRATFYNKLKKKSFTVPEMIKISSLLFPEEAEAYEIKQALEKSRIQSKNGDVKSHDAVIANARKRIVQ